jgi:transcriptional regulator with PAS, ATPase and Fis domain
VIPITIPPLQKPPLELTAQARELLLAHEWPGNSRELSNAIEYAVLVTRGNSVRPSDLPASVRQGTGAGPTGESLSLRERLLQFEKEVISDAVRRSTGDRREIARILGIDPRNVSYFLKKHGLR